MTWFENSARVPMLFYAPKLFEPKRIKENVSTMDMLPTFVDLVGGSLIKDLPLDGVSLMPDLTGGEGPRTDTVYGEYMGEGTQAPLIMIRRGCWKFIYSTIDPPMLFNVAADPEEKINLAAGLFSPSTTRAPLAVKSANPLAVPASLPTPGDTPRVLSYPPEGWRKRRLPLPHAYAPTHPQPSQVPDSARHHRPPQMLAYFTEEVHARWDLGEDPPRCPDLAAPSSSGLLRFDPGYTPTLGTGSHVWTLASVRA